MIIIPVLYLLFAFLTAVSSMVVMKYWPRHLKPNARDDYWMVVIFSGILWPLAWLGCVLVVPAIVVIKIFLKIDRLTDGIGK